VTWANKTRRFPNHSFAITTLDVVGVEARSAQIASQNTKASQQRAKLTGLIPAAVGLFMTLDIALNM
jgi:hypothetical protein